MFFVATIDFISFLSVIIALIALVRGWNQTLPYDIEMLILGLLGLALFHDFSNVLEWGGITSALDPFEDFLELLVPMMWFGLIYSYLKELTTNDLRKSERRLKESQEIAQMGQWELDLVSNSLYCSDGIYSLFEIDPKKFNASYEAFIDAVHPDDREFVDKSYTDSIKNKTQCNITHRLLFKNGTMKYVNEICRTEYDKSGRPLCSIGTIQDITERKLAEEAMRESEEKFRTMMNAMKDPVYICSPDYRIEYMNPAMIKRTGYDATGDCQRRRENVIKCLV
jgi:PAS domain S-box-containing protein